MRRRPFFHRFLFVLFAAALLAAGCTDQSGQAPATREQSAAPAAKIYHWKLAMTWPSNFPIFSSAVQHFADTVKTMSGGQMVIQIDSANKTKAPFGVFDMVKEGQYQMGHSASYYWKGTEPSTMFFTTMPFGMTAPEQYAWFYYGGGMQLMQKVYGKHGLYSFPGGNTGVQMGGWFRKQMKTLKDLKGLKMRIPGFAGEVLSQLGVVVTNIAPGELYTSLERGNIDALEWVGPALDLKMGFQKIAPYYYTGWHEPAAELQFLVNRQAFDELPKNLQEILVTAMKAEALDAYAHMYNDNAIGYDSLRTDYPQVKVETFPKPILDALKAANQRLLGEYAAKDPLFKEVLDSQRAYLAKVRPWSIISDYDYLRDNQGD